MANTGTRTLCRDADRRCEPGYPVEIRRGAAGGYQFAAGTALPPRVIDGRQVRQPSLTYGGVGGVLLRAASRTKRLSARW